MLRSIPSISRFFGGNEAFLDVLQQFANAGEGEGDPHCGLKDTLSKTKDLEGIFAQISEGGPYSELEKTSSPDRIKLSYGTCYGGTCGMGVAHTYEQIANKWELIPGDIDIWIH